MVLLSSLSFCVQPTRIERKERERKGGLEGGIEAEAHIWVIGDDRPRIIPPNNRTSERWEGGVGGGGVLGRQNPMEVGMRHSTVAAWKKKTVQRPYCCFYML